MNKRALLEYLAEVSNVTAVDLANLLGATYAATAMSMLRLVRQGLVTRAHLINDTIYSYELSPKGWERLEFFRQERNAPGAISYPPAPPNTSPQSRKGNLIMRQKRLHTGIFHCPQCFIEYELTNEESLACDRCKGPLDTGTLDQVWSDDADEEEDDD